MAPNPTDRPSIDDILNHPFVLGPLTTERLLPISKTTKALILSIESDGKVFLKFMKNSSTVEVSKEGLEIRICGHNDEPKIYHFYNLPQNQWKKYFYAHKFIDLVKGKTPKITIHTKNENIVKCCLMENNDFEVTLYRPDIDQTNKMLVNDYNQIENTSLRKRVKELHSFCLKTEKELKVNHKRNGIDCFPITFGRKSKIKSETSQSHSSQQQIISSQTLRSIQIEGIGEASQVLIKLLLQSSNNFYDLAIERCFQCLLQ